jgi:3-oxoacyl-[acyl-carrier-protein] synthase II
MSGDAFHITMPPEDGHGARRVMLNAITDAGVKPSGRGVHQRARHIDSTQRPHRNVRHSQPVRRSRVEAGRQFHQVDDRSPAWERPARVEAGITSLVVQRGVIPPTINYENTDPDSDLDYRPQQSPRGQGALRTFELVRVWRHQRLPAFQTFRRIKPLGGHRPPGSFSPPSVRR